MGYRGKVEAQAQARSLRAQGLTLLDIATALAVSKSSVSLWVRDVEFTPSPRRTGAQRRPHPAHEAKLRQIEELNAEGVARIGVLSDEAFLVAGVALYAGEGAKRDHEVKFANTDPRMVRFFCAWFRRYFEIDEGRLRVRVYLHEGLDLDAAQQSGPTSPTSHSPSFALGIVPLPTPPFGTTGTNTAACTWCTAARRRIAGSWASCGRC